jgi:chaperone LolA
MDSEKCLRRRLLAPIERFASIWNALASVIFVIAIATAGGVAAQAVQPATDVGRGFAQLEGFLDGVKTLKADFKQQLYGADDKLLETETGSVSLSRPNRFRWSYVEPTELVVVADGSKLWMYDVELAQVTVAPLDEGVGASPALLLSGDSRVRDGFDVVESYSRDGLDWVKLAPKAASADFASVLIGFDGKAPRRIELVDGLKQITRIELENVVLNPEVASSLFEFKPPAGVDVIGGEG